jgi:(1->4)-alpha-D-glucan 1-alpha-D-glucosylmutase
MRLNVLSEIPGEWERVLQRWQAWNRGKKTLVNGAEVPDANAEYLLYQTLVGAWPLEPMDEAAQAHFVERLVQYMEKALKEAKVHTSWLNPHATYDQAVRTFVQRILTPGAENRFLADLVRFHARVAYAGMLNSLAQTLLKITSPGVPDFYQGTELWDFSLVDPDNRRPVDFPTRMALLEEVQQRQAENPLALVQELLTHWWDSRVKLYVTYKALHFRKMHAELFRTGDYLPLTASGARHEHVVAFAQRQESTWVLVVVPRWLTMLTSRRKPPVGRWVWRKNLLPLPADAPPHWVNVLTGETLTATAASQERALYLQHIFQHFPVALLFGTAA